MASFIQGYDQERFVTKVNQNFLCLICSNVPKDPVLCPRNQHCFCRGCITKHLGNSQKCPTCNDELTEKTLTELPKMVKDIINELNIHCVYQNRGCQEILQLQHLDGHETTCGYTPAVCTNQGCGETLNQQDIIHHESAVCEFRKLKCHSCEETKTTLVNVEERIANVEKNVTAMEAQMKNLEENIEKNTKNMEGKLDAVNNDVRGLQTTLIDAFNEMKDVLVKMDGKKAENTRKVVSPSGDKENIIVAGGTPNGSVEMFNWRQRTWSPLQSMPEARHAATSFVYNNHLAVAGGYDPAHSGYFDHMIRMNIDPLPDFSTKWSNCPVKLSSGLIRHSSLLYKDHLIVTGGYDGNVTSDCIRDVQLVPPYTVKTLSRMTEPRWNHCTELFDDSLLVLGGTTTGKCRDNLNSVVLYDIKKNEWKQLSPLPYEVSQMATVRWEDNVVVIGGIDKQNNELNSVIIYNVKTEQSRMLPAMKFKRCECTAVVIQNNIVVLGGYDGRGKLKSVEAFNFERYTWEELPEMSQARCLHTSVVVYERYNSEA